MERNGLECRKLPDCLHFKKIMENPIFWNLNFFSFITLEILSKPGAI